MKTILKFILGGVAFALVCFNVALNDSQSKNDYSLANIKVLQASASEFMCDCTNSSSCTIKLPDGTICSSSGNGHVWN